MFIIYKYMFDSILLNNPYAKIYEQSNILANPDKVTKEDASNLIKHLGFMYNTFGKAIKDFVKIVSYQFEKPEVKPIATEPKFLMKRGKQQHSDSNIYENNPTQNPRKKDQTKPKKNNEQINKKKLNTIKQQPRIANSQDFDLQFMKQQINEVQQQLKAQAELEQGRNLQNFNNLSRFHSQFTKVKPAQPINFNNSYNNTNGSLLNPPKNYQKNRQKRDETLQIAKNEIENEPIANIQVNIDQQQAFQVNQPKYKLFEDEQEIVQNSYSRAYGGKKRKEREKMSGITCIQCQKYYKVMQIEGPGPNHCACTSRHRTNKQAPKKIKNNFTQQFDCL